MTISVIGVIGAGQMGRGIAQVSAQAGHNVLLFDQNEDALSHAQSFIESQLKRGVEKGKWSEQSASESLERLGLASMEDLESCDVVIEAASENKAVKKQIFSQLDSLCPQSTLFATNTSSISITDLASATKRPDRFIGMHFMNPVPVMKLVEIIAGLETSEATQASVTQLTEKMGKIGVVARDMPGFAVNRILMPMINEAIYTLHEGIASAQDIDTAMKLGTNQPMGPLELADFIGLDTCLSIMEVLLEGLGDTKYRPCPLLRQYVLANRLGRKNGRGFYEYKAK